MAQLILKGRFLKSPYKSCIRCYSQKIAKRAVTAELSSLTDISGPLEQVLVGLYLRPYQGRGDGGSSQAYSDNFLPKYPISRKLLIGPHLDFIFGIPESSIRISHIPVIFSSNILYPDNFLFKYPISRKPLNRASYLYFLLC